ncbi:MAG: deoxyribose-phosphate aldolase [Coriobacteriia bacterium]|nr:deoxyribose-phosphate aldolase [Coriobacteriia bacterium]
MNLAKYIDHTNLAVDASESDIRLLCAEAIEHGFAAVCINPIWVKLASDLLRESRVKTCTVIGFPTGAHMAEVKLQEAQLALANGADELDTVINVAALKANDVQTLQDDIAPLADAAHAAGATLKVILETALLSDAETVRACELCWKFGADYVKTSTSMLKGEKSGASIHAVKLMHQHRRGISNVGDPMGVKASGGIRDFDTAVAMIEAGATRLGTSSGIAIVTDSTSDSDY